MTSIIAINERLTDTIACRLAAQTRRFEASCFSLRGDIAHTQSTLPDDRQIDPSNS